VTSAPAFPAIRVRPASLADYDALVALFDELDELHRQARPDFSGPLTGRRARVRRSSSG